MSTFLSFLFPPENNIQSKTSIENSNQSNVKNVVYWRCEVGHSLHKSLWIPAINTSKEKALHKVAKLVNYFLSLFYELINCRIIYLNCRII